MEVKLIVVGGKHAGQVVSVPGPKFFIGRSEDCQLRPQSDLVSRHHAVILVEEGFVALRDFGSKNGTFLNGQRIRAERELKTGDRVKFGPLEFEVQLGVTVGGKKKPKVQSVREAASRTVQAAAEEDVDIFDLLGGEDEAATASPASDARTAAKTATNAGAVDETVVARTEELEQAGQKNKEIEDKKKAKRKPAGLPPSKKPTARDSQSAADDVLRQFLARRS